MVSHTFLHFLVSDACTTESLDNLQARAMLCTGPYSSPEKNSISEALIYGAHQKYTVTSREPAVPSGKCSYVALTAKMHRPVQRGLLPCNVTFVK